MSAALVGRTALVTGASRGIGAAVARALAADGARVAVTARSAATLDALASQLGAGHLAIPADLTDVASVEAMAARVTAWAGGPPDLLINNAGVFPR
ncbi:MAG: SDR family NAD(P)-dependent oxidoreductase, partial [Gemmatimonadaceae bacterium]|nr:SDR family NAD(P)-dependent oxidoreductase [Gemmatimonadaceae bacterium]